MEFVLNWTFAWIMWIATMSVVRSWFLALGKAITHLKEAV